MTLEEIYVALREKLNAIENKDDRIAAENLFRNGLVEDSLEKEEARLEEVQTGDEDFGPQVGVLAGETKRLRKQN